MPAAGVNAPMVRTRRPSVPMAAGSLARAFFWRGDGVPGMKGSVLISLHSNRYGWAAGNNLPSLRKGNTVRIATPGGVLQYRVIRSNPRAPLHMSEKDMAKYQSNIGASRIVLTTCNKHALGRNGQYIFRSIAQARLVE